MKTIITDDLPAWCRLGFDPNKPAILFYIHKDFIQNELTRITPASPIVQDFQSKFPHMGEFKLDFAHEFGFEGIFKRKEKNGPKNRSRFYAYEVVIPELRKEEICPSCNGGGKDFDDGACGRCEGSGKYLASMWNPSHSIASTFHIISLLLSYPEQEYTGKEAQLLTFNSGYRGGMSGSGVSGIFSKKLCVWFRKRGTGNIQEMIDAMKCAWTKMNKKFDSFYEFNMRASIDYENGWLNVSCPGNACGINPSCGGVDGKNGYGFDPHNMDTPMQQLTILAGLAALYQLAHKEIYGKK